MYYILPKRDCPHVLKDNLISIDKFKEIPFDKLKCQKCDESTELWICLICGLTFCSRYANSHFIEHNRENKDHLLCLGIMDLSIWCYECTQDNNNNESEDNKGFYIVSPKTNEYIKIYEEFKFHDKSSQKEIITANKDDKLGKNTEKEFKTEKNLCSHILNDEIKSELNENFDYFTETMKIVQNLMKDEKYICLCLSFVKRVKNLDDLNKHFDKYKHRLYLNLINSTIICKECKSEFDYTLVNNILKYRIFFHLLHEKNMALPKVNLLSEEEVYEIKYNKFVKSFKDKKYSKILFMVGAGISTSAGIPDFRSKTGLFKQLQDKYNLSSPEEFFYISTFLQKPQYFYEFTKLFDLSQIKS